MVRDRIALDSLRVIMKLEEMSRFDVNANDATAYDVVRVLDNSVMLLVAFAGLASESMTRTQGWRFLDFGRRIERSLQIALSVRNLLPLKPTNRDETSALESLLMIHDSIMTASTDRVGPANHGRYQPTLFGTPAGYNRQSCRSLATGRVASWLSIRATGCVCDS
jgi:uncharacterized alpha-E superfamily protein